MAPTPLNVHRLLITGILLAAKLMDDNYFNNAYYAKVSAVRRQHPVAGSVWLGLFMLATLQRLALLR